MGHVPRRRAAATGFGVLEGPAREIAGSRHGRIRLRGNSMVPARSRLILAVTLSVGTLHAQGVESTPKISHVINVPYTLRLTAATTCDATAHAAMSSRRDAHASPPRHRGAAALTSLGARRSGGALM